MGEWREKLEKLNWKFGGACGTCGSAAYKFTRNGDNLKAWPGRDFFEFTEKGQRKTGRLSDLDSIIKAAAEGL